MSTTAPAVRAKKVPFGRPSLEEKGRLLGAIEHLLAVQSGGKRNPLFLAEGLQRLVDQEDQEDLSYRFRFGQNEDGEINLQGVPKHLLFGGENLFCEVMIHGSGGGETPVVGEKHRLTDLAWQHVDGSWRNIHTIKRNSQFDFSRTHVQNMDNVCSDHSLLDCANMIRRAEVNALGSEHFIVCLALMDRWPVYWKDYFDLMKGGRGTRVIIFVGNIVRIVNSSGEFYLGFRMISTRDKMDALCVPALYPACEELGNCRDEFYFAVQQ